MVQVIVPWRGGCPHRELAWEWVSGLYAERHPEWDVAVAEAPPGPWIKALAVVPAIAASAADVVVVADADVWSEGLTEAVAEAADGAPWAIPHRGIFRLSAGATAEVLAGADPWERDLDQRAYLGVYGGGVVVGRPEVLRDVPLDPRFVGWGQEDHSWGLALHALLGRPWRGKAPLLHLWHPAQDRLSRRYGSVEGKALWQAYGVANRRGPDAIRELIEEGKRALRADQPPLSGREARAI